MRHSVRFSKLLALLGLAVGIVPSSFGQDDLPPEFLRAHALVVRFLASSFVGSDQNPSQAPGLALSASSPPTPSPSGTPPPPPSTSPPTPAAPTTSPGASNVVSARPQGPLPPQVWSMVARRYTVTGAPVAIRLSGQGIVIVVQVTPYDHGKDGLVVVAQGQVWLRGSDGRIAYHSAYETLNVGFGEPLYFFPLGINSNGTASIRVEIAVDRFGDQPSIPDDKPSGQDQSGKQDR